MGNVGEDASDWGNVGENASDWAGGKGIGQTDAEIPCEAWRRGLLRGPLGGSEALGARGPDGEETSGGGVARGGKGSGTGNGGGAGTRGIGWDGAGGGGSGSKGTGGGGSPGEECASTHRATSETEDRWVSPSADWYRRVGCQPGERVGPAERLPVCGERKMGASGRRTWHTPRSGSKNSRPAKSRPS